jgi:hypothetical protein
MLVGLAAHADTVRLAAVPAREVTTILLGAPPAAMVQETRTVDLGDTPTTLELTWGGTRLLADSLTMEVAEPGVTIEGPVFPAARGQLARWTLTPPRALRTTLTVRYRLEGLVWEPQYEIDLGEPSRLSAAAVVRNDSGEDFERTLLDLGLSAAVEADLKQGAELRLPYVAATGLRCRLVYVYDPERAPDPEQWLELENTQEAGLGMAPLPTGKLRVFAPQGGERLLVGEVRLPDTPVGAEAEMALGTAQELTVERRVLRAVDTDVRKDVHGRMALWNREEEIAFEIESRKGQDAVLRIVAAIDGEWTMLSNTHEFEQTDAGHLEFTVPLAAHSTETVKYKVRRLDITP